MVTGLIIAAALMGGGFLLWRGSIQGRCYRGEEVEVQPGRFKQLAARSRASVKRVSPTVHPRMRRYSTYGHVGNQQVNETLFDNIATAYGGGIYEVSVSYSNGKLFTTHSVAGEPALALSEMGDDDGDERGGKDSFFSKLGKDLSKEAVKNFLNPPATPPTGQVTEWANAINMLAGNFITLLQSKQKVQELPEDQQRLLFEMVTLVAGWFLEGKPEMWAAGEIHKAASQKAPEALERMRAMPVFLAESLLRANISQCAPAAVPLEKKHALVDYCMAILKDLKARQPAAASQGGAA
jgi:hypothetical protein